MKLARYKAKFTFEDLAFQVVADVRGDGMRLEVARADTPFAQDETVFELDGTRNLLARGALDDGRILEVEANYVDWISFGFVARVDGAVVFESRPGKVLAWPKSMAIAPKSGEARAKAQADLKENGTRFQRNLPSLLTDIALGIGFFLVGREFGIVNAAIAGAVAGVVLWVVQKITRIDLLGGLAVFGIGVSIVSAAFAYFAKDPMIVQMRSTIIGGAVAALFLSDGIFFKGKFLGQRLERYMPPGTLAPRLAVGIGLLGVFMALANWAVARFLSEEQWLFYTTFLDMPLGVAAFFFILQWARPAQAA
jgi:intracellular septation protein A